MIAKDVNDMIAETHGNAEIAPPTETAPNSPETTKKKIKTMSNKGQLTRKQKALVDTLIANPKMTQAEAYKQVYDVKPNASKRSIDVQASQTMRKPSVISYLANYNNLVENTLVNTVNDWGSSDNTRQREIAVNTSMYLHDKIHGKATQKIQSESKIVSISVNLTGDGELPPENL